MIVNRTLFVTIPSLCGALVICAGARADAPTKPAPALADYFAVLQQKRLAPPDASVEELREMLQRAELLALDGHHEAAALLLYEIVESPRFADYAELHEMSAARFALGSSLHALGADDSARKYLRQVIDQGTEGGYFAPAFRRYVDVTLARRDLPTTLADVAPLSATLPDDARDEVSYLHGRERFDAGDDAAAAEHFARVGTKSRFYASAQYLQGALAARARRFPLAEQHFCRVAAPKDDSHFAFRVDQRYFEVKDFARLGLGRVAHEQGRSSDAFYYYFQVPSDSHELPHAMFEAAYAMYEGGDHDKALDLLDQLEARFPDSALADEAWLLRGYAALLGCDFEKARRMFTRFIERFSPLLDEADRIAKNPARREVLYEALTRSQAPAARAPEARRGLLALLRVDPAFGELHERLRRFDAEVARSARVGEQLELIAARVEGSDRPRAHAAAEDPGQALSATKQDLRDGRLALRMLTQQLDAMASHGAKRSELRPLEAEVSALAARLRALEDRVDRARIDVLDASRRDPEGLQPLFAADLREVRGFDARIREQRAKLVRAANERGLAALHELRERLAGYLRRARIGRIDAVMGSKRRIERQIEQLSAGMLPAGMRDPLRVQGFLSDDEEYWPFEGEDWPDEFEEHYDTGGEP